MRFRSLLAAFLVVGACDCDDEPAEGCVTSVDCDDGELCIDSRCTTPEPSDAAMGEDGGSDMGGGCPSMILCGSPAVCCAPGDECIEGACLLACASGVRCGADRSACCGDGQVCVSDACVDPGASCTDSFDCPMGSFCEPTLDRCLPQFDPVECTSEPVFGDFDPEIEWSLESSSVAADCLHGISAPVIADLSGDGIPEVVANFACDADWQLGVLRAMRGDTGEELWVASDTGQRLNGRTSIAAGDLDGDGLAEIVGVRVPSSGRVIAFDDDGSTLWESTEADGTTPYTISSINGAPSLADLDGDGSPEIVIGAVVLDAAGRLLWERDGGGREGTNATYTGGIAAIADVDLDGEPEIVTGRRAYEGNGDALWTASTPDGYPAIAQFDEDPQPEVVLVASGDLYLLDGMTGAIEWGPIAQPGGGIGGPPTIADFDGDGMPEIGVAGAASYSVYDPSTASGVLWSMTTQDLSSNATGSSVFDFEGDGAAEVVYADECYMRVYRGSDGEVLLEIPSSSATIHEYPLVADVDADGNSEIVIVANDRSSSLRVQCLSADASWDGARKGVFVYGDTRDQWVRTRRIWNQHAYHVTNVEASGAVPATERDNWSTPGLNNYRQNVQGEGVFNAPDLAVLALEARLDGCPTSATLRARVTNVGSLGVEAGVPVSFYSGTPDALGSVLGTVTTTVPLLPGASTVVELSAVALEGEPPFAFVAIVDDDGSAAGIVTECDEENNRGAIADLDCNILL